MPLLESCSYAALRTLPTKQPPYLRAAWEAAAAATLPQAGGAAQPPAAASQHSRHCGADDSWEAAAADLLAGGSGHRHPVARASANATASRSAGTTAAPGSSCGAAGDGGEQQQLQFGGGHVLEFYDLTPAVRTQHLEAALERWSSGHAAPPTLRRVPPPPLLRPWLLPPALPPLATLMHQAKAVLCGWVRVCVCVFGGAHGGGVAGGNASN